MQSALLAFIVCNYGLLRLQSLKVILPQKMIYKCLVLLTVLAVQQTVASTTSDSDGSNGENECVSQQQMADMQGQMDTLLSRLNYWQNVTINILKELYFSPNSASRHDCEVGDTNVDLSVLNNITETIKETNERLERLQSSVDQLQQSHAGDNTTLEPETIKETNMQLEGLHGSVELLQGSVHQLQDSVKGLEGAVEQLQGDIHLCCNETTGSFHNPAHNCSHIVYSDPNATSGYYWLQSSPGYAVQVYCDVERVCGCDEGRRGRGGWMRVADIDMTRHKENCPTGFREVTSSGKKMCGGRGGGCVNTSFSSHGVEYSRVCGRIIGYQFGRPDAFERYHTSQLSIDSYFLDGIVLTYGSPRCHIWSFAAGPNQYKTNGDGCPCNSDSFSGTIPPYVQNDYFCDSGHQYSTGPLYIYYVNDPLWDGAGCVRGSCCQFNSPPWFCKDLPHPTSEDIELRLCTNAALSNEDVPFEVVEIYVQ